MLWAPLRKPHENALDAHWLARQSCADVAHPELGRAFRYATSKWLGTATAWSVGRRAPLLHEDAEAVAMPLQHNLPVVDSSSRTQVPEELSPRGKPFPLHNIRILDFTWFLASAGGTRFLSAFGAESIKVELKTHPDTRMAAMARRARTRHGATASRDRRRYGWAIQQQEPWQAGYLAERQAPKGSGDRQTSGGHV
jgi:crotonobetainyl-CoA:carnitine CoA-transferase CaiB-like acyl-CoA transferase